MSESYFLMVTVVSTIAILVGCCAYIIGKSGEDFYKTTTEFKGIKINNKKAKLIGVLLIIVGVFGFAVISTDGFSDSHSSSSSQSEWDKLSPEEQEWYERNYGGGKAEAYNDAINSYKATH